MKNRSETPDDLAALQRKLAGFGECSVRKTYYPELQQRIWELERFKAFIDNSNDLIFLLEAPTGRIVDVNDSAGRQMGWTREEFLDSSLMALSDLSENSLAKALIESAPERVGQRALIDAQFRTRDGGSFPVELTLNRMSFQEKSYVLVVARDVSERKKAEEALRRNEQYLKSVVDNIPAMVFAKEAADLSFVTFNKAGEELLGIAREDILGKCDSDLFPEAQARSFMEKDRLTLEKGELVEIPEETVQTGSGKNVILHTKKIPLLDEQGRPRYLLGIAEDITERKHLQEQLLQSQKMEAIGQLAGGVAHDFNNILMVIMGYGAMLVADDSIRHEQKEKVKRIIEAADRAAQLTSSLLAFSRKQVMKLRITNVNDIVLHVEKFLIRIIGEDVHLKSVPCGSPLCADVDAGQIEQVLINLATNARDAMPKGGDLTIETSRQNVDHLFVEANGVGMPGPYAVISVSDTGTGMDEKTRLRIFEPFFTTKEAGKGTGLGMSIVYGIVKQHNGFLNVYSEPGLGTTFRIYLPLVDTDTVPAQEKAPAAMPRGGTETILVAEDEPNLRKFLETILTDYGYRVIVAEDGRDAVEKFRNEPGKIGLVLMDIVMPRMQGREAGEAIKETDPSARVLYTSGYTADIIEGRQLLEEGTEVILKPIQPLELLRKVREVLDR